MIENEADEKKKVQSIGDKNLNIPHVDSENQMYDYLFENNDDNVMFNGEDYNQGQKEYIFHHGNVTDNRFSPNINVQNRYEPQIKQKQNRNKGKDGLKLRKG